MKPIGWIYLTTNLVNEKIYIGKHEILKNKSLNASYIGSGTLFKRALKKYGKENFKRKILRICYTLHELRIWEHVYIKKYHSQDPNIGYNIADGDVNSSEYNPAKLPEVREKIKDKIRERGGMRGDKNPNYGKHWNVDSRNKLSKSLMKHYDKFGHPRVGKKHTFESKLKMSNAKSGKYIGDKNPNYGKHWSDEVKEKIRIGNLGKKISEEQKKLLSDKMKGKNNPMYGTRFLWINNGVKNKRHNIGEEIPDGWFIGMIKENKI